MHRSSLIGMVSAWLFAAAILSALAPQASAQEKLKMRLDFLPTWRHAPFFFALEKGWYKDAGLDVTIDDGSGSAISVQLVQAGEYDLALANLSVMAVARGKGAPVKAIGEVIHKNDLGLMVDKNLHIKSLKDVEAKKVSIIYEAGSFQSLFRPFFHNGGVDVDKIELTSMSPAVAITQYVAGTGGGVITAVPYVLPMIADKRPSDIFMFADYGLPLKPHGLVVSETTLATRARALRPFLAVSARAWEELWRGGIAREAVADALIKARPQVKFDRQVVLRQMEAYAPYSVAKAEDRGKSVLWMDPEDWTKSIAVMKEVGLVPAGSKAADFYTNALLAPEAK